MCLQGLQIYCYSSLAKRQINLIRAQPSRENFEGSRVQLRNTWGQLTSEPPLKEYFLPLPWAELAAHQQHLQMQVSQDRRMRCVLLGSSWSAGTGDELSWWGGGSPTSNPRHKQPRKRLKMILIPIPLATKQCWGHWMKNRDGKKTF